MLFYALIIEQFNSTQIKIFGKELKITDNRRTFGSKKCIVVNIKPEYLYFLEEIEVPENTNKIVKLNYFYDEMPEKVELYRSDRKNLMEKLKTTRNGTSEDKTRVITEFSSLAEQFIITKRIKGPSVLEISDVGETATYFETDAKSITLKESNVDFPPLKVGSCFIHEGYMKVNIYEIYERKYTFIKSVKYNQIGEDIDILAHHNLRINGKPGIWTVDTFECAKTLIKGRSFSLDEIIKNSDCKDKTFEALLSLNILDLSKELSEITGHYIHRTMSLRAERTEYLLMHTMWASNWLIYNKVKRQQNTYTALGPNEDMADDIHIEEQSYTGGLVFSPKTGLFEDVILIDFNSLYPSIVIENNLCFSTRKTLLNQDEDIELEKTNEMALLPKILFSLIDRRKKIKRELKQANMDEKTMRMYDARQQALKITANSIYGCLGSSNRFSDVRMASFITAKGRELLLQAKNEIEKANFSVIYGDTDSLMVHIQNKDIDKEIARRNIQFNFPQVRDQIFYEKYDDLIRSISNGLCSSINDLHEHIVIELEDIFRKILFLSKKKYAGLTNQGNMVMKGIERRDYCKLSNAFIGEIVDCILKHKESNNLSSFDERNKESPVKDERFSFNKDMQGIRQEKEDKSTLFDKIMTKLVDLKTKIKAYPQSHFIIERLLTKPPEKYKAPQGCAHVMLALRINEQHQKTKQINLPGKERIGPFKKNDIISYIIGDNNDAFLPSETTNINFDYYLKNQILSPLFRILGVLEGFNIDPIRKLFGIETKTKSIGNLRIETKCCSNEQTNMIECLKCMKNIDKRWLEKEIYKKVTDKAEILYERNFVCTDCDHKQQIRLRCFNCNSSSLIIDGIDKKNQDFDRFLEDLRAQSNHPLIDEFMNLSEYRTVDLALYFPDEIRRGKSV